MLLLIEALNDYNCVLVTYDGPNNVVQNPQIVRHYTIRHVLSDLGAFFSFFIKLSMIVFQEKPALVLSTGGEISLPIMYISKLYYGAKTMFIECSAQVKTPSYTGRLIYPVADLVLVQWPSLLGAYGAKAEYVGGLV
jgi:UDP-N-acetylglucosamine:LPS N-acetylglucosamine transferase